MTGSKLFALCTLNWVSKMIEMVVVTHPVNNRRTIKRIWRIRFSNFVGKSIVIFVHAYLQWEDLKSLFVQVHRESRFAFPKMT